MRTIFCLLVVASLADFWFTNELISQHGFTVEANPLLYHWMVQANTSYVILGFKVATLVALGIGLAVTFSLEQYKVSRTRVMALTTVATFLQCGVAALGAYMVIFSGH